MINGFFGIIFLFVFIFQMKSAQKKSKSKFDRKSYGLEQTLTLILTQVRHI